MKKGKWLGIALILVLIVSMLVIGCAKPPAAPPAKPSPAPTKPAEKPTEVVILKHCSGWPTSHHLMVKAYKPWAKIVEEKTDGRIKIEYYWGGAIASTKDTWDAVVKGAADFGLTAQSYKYTSLLVDNLAGLPFAFRGMSTKKDMASAEGVMDKVIRKYGMDEYKDAHFLGCLVTDSYDLFAHKPVRKYEDLKGMKIRISGRGWDTILKSWGAVPVSITAGELYTALQRGILDAAFYSPVGGISMKFYEPGPYITKVRAFLLPLVDVFNKRSWEEKVPDDLKPVFEKTYQEDLRDLWIKDYVEAAEEAVKFYKDTPSVEYITLSEEDLAKMAAATMVQWDAWVKDANKEGLPGEEIMSYFRDTLKQEGWKPPE